MMKYAEYDNLCQIVSHYNILLLPSEWDKLISIKYIDWCTVSIVKFHKKTN